LNRFLGGQWVFNSRESRRPTKALNYVNKGDKIQRPIPTLDLECDQKNKENRHK